MTTPKKHQLEAVLLRSLSETTLNWLATYSSST